MDARLRRARGWIAALLLALPWSVLAQDAADRWLQAQQAANAGRTEEALALMQQLADSQEPLDRARGLVGLTGVAIRTGKATQRKQEIAEALELLRKLPQARADLGLALIFAAEVAAASDDNAGRLRLGEEAIALYAGTPGRERELMDALLRTSNADARLGRTAEGEAKVTQAAEIAERIGASPTERVRILGRQAAFAYGRGALEEAAQRYEQMRSLAAAHIPESLEHASALANGAMVAAERGHLAAARRDYERALDLRRRVSGRSQMIATDLMTLAEIENRLGDLDAARTHLDEARQRLAELDSRSELHVGALVKLAQIDYDRGDTEAAQTLFEQARALAEDLPFECACKAQTLIWLSWFQLRAGQAEAALAGYQRAIDRFTADGGGNVNLPHAQAGKAEALVDLGRADEARAALSAAMPKLVEAAPDSPVHAHLEWLQGRVADELGDGAAAREHYCRASRILDRASLAGGGDVGQARFRRRYVEIYRACIEAAARDEDAAAVFDGLERLRLRRAAGEAATEAQVVITLAQVQQRMPARTALLGFLASEDALRVLVVASGHPPRLLRLPLPRARLAAEVAALRARVLARVDARDPALQKQARKLYAALLAPVAEELRGTRQLLLAPDGPLHELPWAALHDGRRWLIERHALAIVDTLSETPHAAAKAGDLLLGVADAGDAALPAAALRAGPLAPLPYARVEIAALGRVEGRLSTLVGEEATEAVVRERLAQAGIAHFAVHAWLNVEQPLQSALMLRPGGSGSEDGLLQAFEIASLRTPARLVVLSGCDTGRGAELEGVGLLGLVRAFRSAGAQRVIASLWPIGDRGTAELFERYYAGGEADPARAWQQVARDALRRPGFDAGQDRERAVGGVSRQAPADRLLPYHWASLQVYGQPW
ncbi:MAG: CHAT domain-containing protein [Rhodanobacteraceae bacterium]|nr:CHAT domain-containing protein [Rhodanobacteraceae bacterium]